jgi:hypothetical protein
MAATAWTLYNKAKKKIGNGTIQLGVNTLKCQLHTSASNCSTATLSTAASVTSEVTNGNGYATGGATLASVVWTTGASASQYKLDSADPVWTATGGNIASIKFALIKNSGGQALCWSRLTTAQFTLTQNNTLTIQMNAAGIFTLT